VVDVFFSDQFFWAMFYKKKFISKAITVDYTLCQKKKPVDYTQAVDRERTKSSRERENCQTM
jgi:hypothetical protein